MILLWRNVDILRTPKRVVGGKPFETIQVRSFFSTYPYWKKPGKRHNWLTILQPISLHYTLGKADLGGTSTLTIIVCEKQPNYPLSILSRLSRAQG